MWTKARLAGLITFFVGAAGTVSGCMGGCYSDAGTVTVVPATACLTLFAGQSATDHTVCGTPQLGGQNDCADALTLPPHVAGGEPIVVEAGAKIFYPTGAAVPPGLTITTTAGTTDYVITAMLGSGMITITIPVR